MSDCYGTGAENPGQYGLAPGEPCVGNSPGFYDSSTGVRLCCGSGTVCGANSICSYKIKDGAAPVGSGPAKGSGYYMGACTDPSGQHPLCRPECRVLGSADVVYQTELGVWACCGTSQGDIDCGQVRSNTSFDVHWAADQFPGPVDKALTVATFLSSMLMPTTTATGHTSSFGSTAVSATAVQTTASENSSTAPIATSILPTSSEAARKPEKLSSGTKAGIGVGAAVGVIMIVALAVAIVLLRRHAAKSKKQSEGHLIDIDLQGDDKRPQPASAWHQGLHYSTVASKGPAQELDGSATTYELGTNERRHELPGSRSY